MRGIAGVVLALVLSTSLLACGDSRPSLDLPKGSTVVVIGDSITNQSTDELNFVLAADGLKPVIRGVSGAAINGAPLIDWHDALAQLVATNRPDAVVVELGTNGCGYCRSLREGIDAVMESARDVPDVLWIDTRTAAPIPNDPKAINEAIRDAGDRWDNLTVVDFDELVGSSDIADDHIHLTDRGQRHFAESLGDVLT